MNRKLFLQFTFAIGAFTLPQMSLAQPSVDIQAMKVGRGSPLKDYLEGWLGVFPVDTVGKFVIDSATVWSENLGMEQVKAVRNIKGKDDSLQIPVFLFRGAQFRIGDTVYSAQSDKPPSGYYHISDTLNLNLPNGNSYVITIAGTKEGCDPHPRWDDECICAFMLKVQKDDKIQYLDPTNERLACFGEGEILWAGDLDRDGKLDLYYKIQIGQGGAVRYVLYLSSHVIGDSLMKRAASMWGGGC